MDRTLELNGQAALVTGGAKGFGRGIAQALVGAGARVFITGRNQQALDAAARDLGVAGLRADVTSPGDWDRVIAEILKTTGRIDILVNNAGGGIRIAPTEEQTDADRGGHLRRRDGRHPPRGSGEVCNATRPGGAEHLRRAQCAG